MNSRTGAISAHQPTFGDTGFFFYKKSILNVEKKIEYDLLSGCVNLCLELTRTSNVMAIDQYYATYRLLDSTKALTTVSLMSSCGLFRATYDTSFSNHIYIIATDFHPMSGQVRIGYHLSSWWRNVPLVYFTMLIDQPKLPFLHVFSKYLASFRVLCFLLQATHHF